MEPAGKKVEFEPIANGFVVLTYDGVYDYHQLWKLGNELYADWYGNTNVLIALEKDGFTSRPGVRWEHFPDPPINIICNSLGRMVCQN